MSGHPHSRVTHHRFKDYGDIFNVPEESAPAVPTPPTNNPSAPVAEDEYLDEINPRSKKPRE